MSKLIEQLKLYVSEVSEQHHPDLNGRTDEYQRGYLKSLANVYALLYQKPHKPIIAKRVPESFHASSHLDEIHEELEKNHINDMPDDVLLNITALIKSLEDCIDIKYTLSSHFYEKPTVNFNNELIKKKIITFLQETN